MENAILIKRHKELWIELGKITTRLENLIKNRVIDFAVKKNGNVFEVDLSNFSEEINLRIEYSLVRGKLLLLEELIDESNKTFLQ